MSGKRRSNAKRRGVTRRVASRRSASGRRPTSVAEAPDEGDDASNRGSVAAVDARGASGRGTPATGGRASVSTAAGSGTSASGTDGAASIAAPQHVLDQQVKQLLAHVRHVVLSTVSTGRDVDGVVDSVLGTVTSLGERDVRFARYRLVKAMRKCLSACAAPSVDAFVSRMLQASPEALLDADMAAVADAYMATPQYQQLRTDIVSQVSAAVKRIVEKATSRPESGLSDRRASITALRSPSVRGKRQPPPPSPLSRSGSAGTSAGANGPSSGWNRSSSRGGGGVGGPTSAAVASPKSRHGGGGGSTSGPSTHRSDGGSARDAAGDIEFEPYDCRLSDGGDPKDLIGDHEAPPDDDTKPDGGGCDGVSLHSDGVLSFSSFNSLPAYERIGELAAAMDPSHALINRCAALEALREYSPGDLTHSEFWPQVVQALASAVGQQKEQTSSRGGGALASEDEAADMCRSLQSGAVEYVWKLFRSSSAVSPVQTCELALLLTTSCIQHNVVNHFQVTADGVIDTSDEDGALLMRKFRLLHKMYCELPRHWVHLPDQLYDQLIIGAFALLRTAKHDVPKPTTNRTIVLSAAECLAILDPDASWFGEWVALARPREQVLRYVAQTGLLSDIMLRARSMDPARLHIPALASTVTASPRAGDSSANDGGQIHSGHPLLADDVGYYTTLQSLSMLAFVVSFAAGRRLFPVFVPKRSAAGLNATNAVRLAQLRGTRDRATNNRLRNLPRHDSTGLVGVGSGIVSVPSGTHKAPMSEALDAFRRVLCGSLVWDGVHTRGCALKLLEVCRKGLVWVAEAGTSVRDDKQGGISAVFLSSLLSRVATIPAPSRCALAQPTHDAGRRGTARVGRGKHATSPSKASRDAASPAAAYSAEQTYAVFSVGEVVYHVARSSVGLAALLDGAALSAGHGSGSGAAGAGAGAGVSTSPSRSRGSGKDGALRACVAFACRLLRAPIHRLTGNASSRGHANAAPSVHHPPHSGSATPGGVPCEGGCHLLSLTLAAVHPFLRALASVAQQPRGLGLLREFGLPQLIAANIRAYSGAVANTDGDQSARGQLVVPLLPPHSYLASPRWLAVLLDVAVAFAQTPLGVWMVSCAGLLRATVRRVAQHYVEARRNGQESLPATWFTAAQLCLIPSGAVAVADSPLLSDRLEAMHALLASPDLPNALHSEPHLNVPFQQCVVPLRSLLTAPHACGAVLMCSHGGKVLGGDVKVVSGSKAGSTPPSAHPLRSNGFDVSLLASGGRVGPPGSMSVVASLPRRLLSGFVRAAAIPGSSASRIKVPCFEDTHCLALMLLDAATTSLDTALAVDMAWGVRPRLVSLQGGVVVDNHASSASARRRRSPTAQASAASHGSVPVFSPVAQRSPTTPTSGADHTSMAPTPTSVATQSRYRDSSPHGSRRVGAGTGGGAPGDGATDASVVDSEIEIDVHAMEEQSLYGNDTNVRAQLGKLGFTTVSGAGVARVSVLLRLEHAGGHREALRLPCVGADPCLVASLDRLPCSEETLHTWAMNRLEGSPNGSLLSGCYIPSTPPRVDALRLTYPRPGRSMTQGSSNSSTHVPRRPSVECVAPVGDGSGDGDGGDGDDGPSPTQTLLDMVDGTPAADWRARALAHFLGHLRSEVGDAAPVLSPLPTAHGAPGGDSSGGGGGAGSDVTSPTTRPSEGANLRLYAAIVTGLAGGGSSARDSPKLKRMPDRGDSTCIDDVGSSLVAHYAGTLVSRYGFNACSEAKTEPQPTGATSGLSGTSITPGTGLPPTKRRPSLAALSVPVDTWQVSRGLASLLDAVRVHVLGLPSPRRHTAAPAQSLSASDSFGYSGDSGRFDVSGSLSHEASGGSTSAGDGVAARVAAQGWHMAVSGDRFDWFAATVFLLVGNSEKCFTALQVLAQRTDPVGPWLWPMLGMSSWYTSTSAASDVTSMPPPLLALSHAVEATLLVVEPHVMAAFRMCGQSPSHVCHLWLTQCFWNTLNFPDVARFVVLAILGGPSYVVCFVVALLRQLKPELVTQAATSRDLFPTLLLAPLAAPLKWRRLAADISALVASSTVREAMACMASSAEEGR